MAKRYTEKEQVVEEKIVLSSSDASKLKEMLSYHKTREDFLVNLGVIKKQSGSSDFIVIEYEDIVGGRTGLGNHLYQFTVPYYFWQEVFEQYDKIREREIYFENQNIFNATGQYPKNEKLQQIRQNFKDLIKQ